MRRRERIARSRIRKIAMPPLIVWTFGAIGAAVVVKWAVKEARRVNAAMRARERAPIDESASVRKLERDPATGIYRPK
jgi:hypothetical protein